MMTFPDTWEEFEKSYGFTDNEEVYTNGARLIPSFRVKQWLDHLPSAQPDVPDTNVGELISRQEAIDALKICDNNEDGINCHKCPLRDKRWDGAWQDDETNCYTKLMRDSAKLLEMPSAQLERKKGKWIKDRDGIYHCSCCNTDYLMYEWAMKDTHYCHNCGCRMEEGDSDDNH